MHSIANVLSLELPKIINFFFSELVTFYEGNIKFILFGAMLQINLRSLRADTMLFFEGGPSTLHRNLSCWILNSQAIWRAYKY